MKKLTIAAKLSAAVVFLWLVSGIASSAIAADAGASAIEKCIGAFESAEPIFADLRDFVGREIEGFDDEEGEYDEQEAKDMIVSLREYAKRLDGLISGTGGQAGDPSSNEGKTLAAVREYLNMLKNISGDMDDLVAYGIDFTEALKPLSEDDSFFDSYGDFADNLYLTTTESLELLRGINPPPYLAISHGDVIARVAEFQDFASDFQWAIYLDDPLRITSCVYRMDRIALMFEKCAENLNSDFLLQLWQAQRRLDGPISTLRDELSAYFALLEPKGRGA